jgi:hypothetical protein
VKSNNHHRPWSVHFIEVEGVAWKKYVVILSRQSTTFYGAFINTQIPDYLMKPHISPCFMLVKLAEHPFLKYDSWLGVNELREYEYSSISQSTLVGEIHINARPDAISSVRNCRVLNNFEKGAILSELDP